MYAHHSALALVIAVCATACGKSDEKTDSEIVTDAQPVAPVAPAAGMITDAANECPHNGLWALCSVERRLRQSGFVAKKIEGKPPERAGFSVKPVAYSLGRSHLEIFLYSDASALERDLAALDTIMVAPRGTTVSPWDSAPTLIRSGNLAAVLLTSSPVQAERLALALTAGAPQLGSPR